MTDILIGLGIACWAACGVVSYGAYFGHFQNRWPDLAESGYTTDRTLAVIWAIFGPLGLFVAFVMSQGFRWGFKWK